MPLTFQPFLVGTALLFLGGLGTLSFITISTAQEVKSLKESVKEVTPVIRTVARMEETLRLQEKSLDQIETDLKELLRRVR